MHPLIQLRCSFTTHIVCSQTPCLARCCDCLSAQLYLPASFLKKFFKLIKFQMFQVPFFNAMLEIFPSTQATLHYSQHERRRLLPHCRCWAWSDDRQQDEFHRELSKRMIFKSLRRDPEETPMTSKWMSRWGQRCPRSWTAIQPSRCMILSKSCFISFLINRR